MEQVSPKGTAERNEMSENLSHLTATLSAREAISGESPNQGNKKRLGV